MLLWNVSLFYHINLFYCVDLCEVMYSDVCLMVVAICIYTMTFPCLWHLNLTYIFWRCTCVLNWSLSIGKSSAYSLCVFRRHVRHASDTSRQSDIDSPRHFRPIGRILSHSITDSGMTTTTVELVRPPHGPYGIYIACDGTDRHSSELLSWLSDYVFLSVLICFFLCICVPIGVRCIWWSACAVLLSCGRCVMHLP